MGDRRDVKRALARDDLHLDYQPIVEIGTGSVVSFEALLRGRPDDRRDWNVADVTQTAEQGSDIFELDDWIVRQATIDAVRWRQGELANLSLNLNLSAREFQNQSFIETLDRRISDAAIEPAAINLEITETASIHDRGLAEEVVGRLQDRGYHIWLDDFGTGHSSLAWLMWFAVDGVKIPSMFTRDMLRDPRCEMIVDGIVTLAKNLRISVTAEGVESESQRELLASKGVEFAQGFLFFKPLALEELKSTLLRKRSLS